MSHSIFDTTTIHYLKGTELYGLGNTSYGTIGKVVTSLSGNTLTKTDIPQHVAPGKGFEFITGNHLLTVGIDVNGRVWTCGTGENSRILGRPTASNDDKRIFAPITSQPERMIKAQVMVNAFMVLGESGRLYAIGKNANNVMGKSQFYINEWFEYLTPVIPHKRFIDFSGAHHNFYAIDDEGNLWGWGCGESYALGENPGDYKKNGNTYGDTLLSDGVMKFKKVVAGVHEVIALREDGKIGAIGSARALITNSANSTYKKFTMNESDKFVFKKIYLNSGVFFGIKEDDTLWVNGVHNGAIEGLNNVSRKNKLKQLGNKKWDQLSPRDGGMYGLQKDGSLWTWGRSSNSLNFISDAESSVIYSPTKVEHITGVTKLKDNLEELEVEEFEYKYDEQKIDITLRNQGLGLVPVHTTSSQVIETRYLFKEYRSYEVYNFIRFTGTSFQSFNTSPEEAFERGHTLEYIKANEKKILKTINERSVRRLYLVAFSKLKNNTDDFFFKEVRQVINETSLHDGLNFNNRIFFPGHSKNVINKELLEFESK